MAEGQIRKAPLAEILRRRILTMVLAPGAVIDEAEIGEEFGLSRSPVREVLRQMAGEGYVELEPNRPPRVTAMSYHALREFYLTGPMIYIATTRLAAEKATAQDVARLTGVQARFAQAISDGNVEERVIANNDFHLEIGIIARNDYLMPSLRRLLIDNGRIGRTFFRNSPEAMAQSEAANLQHDQMIEAIDRHDPDAAEAVVRAHFELSRRNMALYAAPEAMNIAPL
jgi:DNA-binding GntR family transcriptional regulator